MIRLRRPARFRAYSKRIHHDALPLRGVFDARPFAGSRGGFTLVFERDRNGQVIGFYKSNGRTRDGRFERIRQGEGSMSYGIVAPEHRLPAESRLGSVHLQVADLDRSVDYYGRVLGLQEITRGGSTVALAAPASSRPLVELHEREGARPVPAGGRPGLYHFALLLPDRPALGALLRHLSTLDMPPGAADHLVSEALYLRDPDGLGIEVYADRPRSSWRQAGDQLVMATRPLDVDDLMRATGDEAWEGMPTETVMGHVHLHVGDLRSAEAFYHRSLGFDKTVWDYPGALFLSAGGYHHHLGLNEWAASAEPPDRDDARLLHWTLQLPHIAAVERASESLARAGHPMDEDAEGVVATDPWGTAVRLEATGT